MSYCALHNPHELKPGDRYYHTPDVLCWACHARTRPLGREKQDTRALRAEIAALVTRKKAGEDVLELLKVKNAELGSL